MQILNHLHESVQQENGSTNKIIITIAENMNNTNKNIQDLYIK